MLGCLRGMSGVNGVIAGSLVQRAKKLMYGQALDAAIMILEEKKNGRGSNVTKVMSDLSIGRDSD